jgi:hypothetical protein
MPTPEIIPQLGAAEAASLSVIDLVRRMDEIIYLSYYERYRDNLPLSEQKIVSDIMNTKQISVLPESGSRKIAHLTFDYLIQLLMNDVLGGISNRELYSGDADETSWRSPVYQLRYSAITQAQIISSRIALEIFMYLLHCIETGRRLESSHSKLKSFRKWLCEIDNKFHYFAYMLYSAYHFNQTLRTPEVHGTSRFPKKILLLDGLSSEDANATFALVNCLDGTWRPLIDILNGVKPSYMNIYNETHQKWLESYVYGSEDQKKTILSRMVAELFPDVG